MNRPHFSPSPRTGTGSAGILPAVFGILPDTLQRLSRVSASVQDARQEHARQQDEKFESPAFSVLNLPVQAFHSPPGTRSNIEH
jgi:hypothetical protein